MKKFVFIIVVLITVILFSYRYLRNSVDEKKTFIFRISSKPLIYCSKKLELEDPEALVFDEYFRILSNGEYQYKYSIEGDSIIVSLNNDRFKFPYTVKEKEKEIVTEYIIKEVYVSNTDHNSAYGSVEQLPVQSVEVMNQPFEYETEYLNISESTLTFETGTDISQIINAIQNSIDTNMRISIDYSSLNPNDPGDYRVYIYSETGNRELLIKIF